LFICYGYFSTHSSWRKEPESEGRFYLLMDLGAKEVIDWGHVFRTGNSWYDRVADACGKPARAERETALETIEADPAGDTRIRSGAARFFRGKRSCRGSESPSVLASRQTSRYSRS
jgi:hypothetical protein